MLPSIYFKDPRFPVNFYKVTDQFGYDCTYVGQDYHFLANREVVAKENPPLVAYDNIALAVLLTPKLDLVSSDKRRLIKCNGIGLRRRFDGCWECGKLEQIMAMTMPRIPDSKKTSIAMKIVANVFQDDFLENIQLSYSTIGSRTLMENIDRIENKLKNMEASYGFNLGANEDDDSRIGVRNAYSAWLLLKAMVLFCSIKGEEIETFAHYIAQSIHFAMHYALVREQDVMFQEIIEYELSTE